MSERIWDKFLTERDKQVFAKAGFGTRQGFINTLPRGMFDLPGAQAARGAAGRRACERRGRPGPVAPPRSLFPESGCAANLAS